MKRIKNISIIYVYFNTPDEIKQSFSSLEKALGGNSYEVIIIDNASSVLLPQVIKNHRKVKFVRNKKNVGYGAALNQGASLAQSEYILCSNTDVIYQKDSISLLLEKIKSQKRIAVVGPKMINENKDVLDTASDYPLFPLNIVLYTFLRKLPFLRSLVRKFHYKDEYNRTFLAPVLGGACMLFRKNIFQMVNGFDEQFFLYFEESDICKRIRDVGYKNMYYKDAVVTHFGGRSLKEKGVIQSFFQRSRFLFVKKHQNTFIALLSEGLIRSLNLTSFLMIGVVSISLFLNLFRLSELMMFFGDFARDMLVARSMLMTGEIPLLGIPSSVVWLHQGPLSIYLIGLSFLFGGFAPWVPAVFYGVLGAFTTLLVYLLGRELFNKTVGLMSALVFATSPLVIINARIPYHTSPIPFFSALFFLILFFYIKRRSLKLLISLGLLFGLLFQLELSNGLLFIVLIAIALIYKMRFFIKDFLTFFSGFFLGITPFILYDISHGFIQTLGFIAWVVNRILLFLGFSIRGNSTTNQAPEAASTVWDQIVRFVFPESSILSLLIIFSGLFLFLTVVFRLLQKKDVPTIIMTTGLGLPLIGFIIHARPGMAYFPVLFPLSSIAIALIFYKLSQTLRTIKILFLILCVANALFVIRHMYFLDVDLQKGSSIPDWNYGLGPSLKEQRDAVTFIKYDSKNKPVFLQAGGFLKDFKTGIDNYHYLLWWEDITQDQTGVLYTVYQDFRQIPEGASIEYMSDNIAIVKNE